MPSATTLIGSKSNEIHANALCIRVRACRNQAKLQHQLLALRNHLASFLQLLGLIRPLLVEEILPGGFKHLQQFGGSEQTRDADVVRAGWISLAGLCEAMPRIRLARNADPT